jgi:hypothetical protein
VNLSRRDALVVMGTLAACGLMRSAKAEGGPMPVGQIARVFTGPDGRSHIGEFALSAREVRAGVAETEWLDALDKWSRARLYGMIMESAWYPLGSRTRTLANRVAGSPGWSWPLPS